MPTRIPTGAVGALGSAPQGWRVNAVPPSPVRRTPSGLLLPGGITIIDPADLDVVFSGTDATLTWSPSQSPRVSDYDVYRRSPATGDPFVPGVDIPVASGVTSPFTDPGLAGGSYEWQVFGNVAPWDPSYASNQVGWWDSSDAATITGSSSASGLADKYGLGADFAQATSGKRPATGSRTINSLNVLDFDGIDDEMAAAISLTGNSFALFCVVQIDALNNDRIFTSEPTDFSSSSKCVFLHTNGTSHNFEPYYESFERATIAGVTTACQITVTRSGATFTIRKDGVDGTPSAGASATNFAVSTLNLFGHGSEYANGAFGEAFMLSAVPSTDDRDLAEAYLKAKWGTP